MTDLFQYPTAHHLDLAFEGAKRKQQPTRHRVVKCADHPQFAEAICPFCPKEKRPREEPRDAIRRGQIARRIALENAAIEILKELAPATPATYTELAWRMRERTGHKCQPANAAVTLDRLRRHGLTAVTIPRTDGKAPGS